MIGPDPTLELELGLFAGGARYVGGCDEVGRGALAGPVSVGVVVLEAESGPPPDGLRDSKLLAPAARDELVPRIVAWALEVAVGHATAAEIDRHGLSAALGLAGRRALRQLEHAPDTIVLDGNFDWLARRRAGRRARAGLGEVTCKVKADLECASVAAASVVAKVTRDALMAELALAHPGYGWAANKGYGSAVHRAAIAELGACRQHRRTWQLLPAEDGEGDEVEVAASSEG